MQTPTKPRYRPITPSTKNDATASIKASSSLTLSSPIKLNGGSSSSGSINSLSSASKPQPKDKVIVCVKARPASSKTALEAYELDAEAHTLALSDTHSRIIKRGRKSGRTGEYVYSFDALHLAPNKTHSLYEEKIAPLVLKCMAGFNSTIFAYGQTGSGKTHTMSGEGDDVGVIPLAITSVFEAIEENQERHYLLRVSYLEIYNESIRDILVAPKKVIPDNERPNIHVENGTVHVRPLVEEIVKSPEDILELLKKGMNNRKTGATDWNERSSRSHCVFTLTIESREGADVRRSKLTLIDLAGSEKAASDIERLAEGKYINRSLLALGTVIEQLSDTNRKPGSHVPYRNSKLTHLLENALGGNANIAVICTLSLEERHQAETLETLKFASRCAQVQTKAVQGIVASSEKAMLLAKEEEIAALRLQLEDMGRQQIRPNVGHDNADSRAEITTELLELEARRNRVYSQLAQLNGEILSSRSMGMGPSGSGGNPAGRLRRRVSDYISGPNMGRSQVTDSPSRASRRAVSGSMAMLLEENENNASGPTFTREDIIKVARYHRRNNSNQVNDLAADLSVADMSRTGLELEVRAMTIERDEWTQRYLEEKEARAALAEDLAEERRRNKQQRDQSALLAEEIARLRGSLDDARQEIDQAQNRVSRLNELGLPRIPIDSTGHAQPSTSGLRHTGSLKENRVTLNSDASAGVEPLPYSVTARVQRSREGEEILKLEKVITGLKTVQDELLNKIEEWRQRVLDQNRMIKSLAHGLEERDPTKISPPELLSPRTPNTFAPTGKKPAEYSPALTPSRSLQSNLNIDKVMLPVTPSRTPKAKNPRLAEHPESPSWFVSGSPRPIPMHDGMISNSSARKGRRLTVENDLNELNRSSRIEEARLLFTRDAR